MTVTRLRNIAPIQLGLVMGAVYALLGIIVALLMLPFAALMSSFGGLHAAGFMGGGIASVILFPIIYGLIGFIGGVLTAFIYNVTVKMTGGIELTFETVESSGYQPAGTSLV